MSKTREQSAIDAIYELLDEVKELRKEVKIIDSNLKLLNNKVSKANSSPSSGPTTAAPVVPVAKPISKPVSPVKVYGRIKNQHRKPIQGTKITIFNAKGEMIKSRETNSDGYWEARILPGSYVVELDARHINKKFMPKNINIELDESMIEYEVK